MLFKRRQRPRLGERIRLWLWPRVSWRRSGLYYMKRTLRLSGTPYAIAMGSALGVAVALTPLLGLHLLITAAAAWLVRANLLAAALASCIGNPVTYPFIWAGTYELGRLLLGEPGGLAPARIEHDLVHRSWEQLWPIIKPMALGSIPIALLAGCIVYLVVYKAVFAYRGARSARFAARRGTGAVGRREASEMDEAGAEIAGFTR